MKDIMEAFAFCMIMVTIAFVFEPKSTIENIGYIYHYVSNGFDEIDSSCTITLPVPMDKIIIMPQSNGK